MTQISNNLQSSQAMSGATPSLKEIWIFWQNYLNWQWRMHSEVNKRISRHDQKGVPSFENEADKRRITSNTSRYMAPLVQSLRYICNLDYLHIFIGDLLLEVFYRSFHETITRNICCKLHISYFHQLPKKKKTDCIHDKEIEGGSWSRT